VLNQPLWWAAIIFSRHWSGTAVQRSGPERRAAFTHFRALATRWMDNDVYGHVNNVVYYSFFDTVVNQFLIEQGVLDVQAGTVVGLVVETQCRYFSPIVFPDVVQAGLRVAHLGNSSVRYELGLFRNDDDSASAQGYFVHVYVDRVNNRPVPLPQDFRRALATLTVP